MERLSDSLWVTLELQVCDRVKCCCGRWIPWWNINIPTYWFTAVWLNMTQYWANREMSMSLHASALSLWWQRKESIFFIFNNAVEGGEWLGFVHFMVIVVIKKIKIKNQCALIKICFVYTLLQKKEIYLLKIIQSKNIDAHSNIIFFSNDSKTQRDQ